MISFDGHIDGGQGARVALGMSGGVDSSVAARMLMDAGFDVLGVTCVFVNDEHADAAVADARAVADLLGVPHIVKDCTACFERMVIDPFVDEYASGRTPSPCVACNRSCKIPSLIEAADEQGCDFVATGHYATVVRRGGRYAVARAANQAKDQSYMLAMLSQDMLARLLLPLGGIAEGKARVREMAGAWGLPVASKSDSQDICFIHGSHTDFLDERGVEGASGPIVALDGRAVGRHKGLHRYTIGQRKGLDIGGAPAPYYVVEKRPAANELVVAFAQDALIAGVSVGGVVWQGASCEDAARACAECGSLPCSVKLRYRQNAVPCRIVVHGGCSGEGAASPVGEGSRLESSAAAEGAGAFGVVLDEPQPATAPGQYAVFYDGDAVLCAGVIESVERFVRGDE